MVSKEEHALPIESFESVAKADTVTPIDKCLVEDLQQSGKREAADAGAVDIETAP